MIPCEVETTATPNPPRTRGISAAATYRRRPGVLIRRNIVFMLMSVEIMLNAAGLAFVIAGARWGRADGQVMFIFIVTMAAAEVSVGLALILQLYHHFKTLDTDAASGMRG